MTPGVVVAVVWGGDVAGEGFITTVDDRMYWGNVYESLSRGAS